MTFCTCASAVVILAQIFFLQGLKMADVAAPLRFLNSVACSVCESCLHGGCWSVAQRLPSSLTEDLKPYNSLEEFESVTGVAFDKDKAKLLMKWCAPEKPPAYVMLRSDESVQYCTGDGRTPCLPHGTWSYFKEEDLLITWFHWKGKRDIDGIPRAEATVLERVTDNSCMLRDVPVWRAVGTLTHEVETWMVKKFVGAAVKEMRSWHVFVQIIWRSQV